MRSDLAVPAAWQCFRYATAPCPCGIKKSRPHQAAGRLWTIVFLFSEVIVHAGAHQAEPVTVRRAGADEVAVGEIDIEIFDPGTPVRRKTHLGAGADGPARIGVGFRQAEGLAAQFA